MHLLNFSCLAQVTLQAILDCAQASFDHYDDNRDVWMNIRSHCKDLLCTEDFGRHQELCDRDVFDKAGDENCQAEWENLLKKFDPDNEDIGSSDYESQAYLCDNIEDKLKDMREKVIAYDQLKAFSLYLKDKPAELAAYHKFLVSIYHFVHAYNIVMAIISHHHSVGALQS